ncbi:hypothetical protein ACHHYP_04569 [Achlya hypogyna]|uniref:Uncharacterized protein n=1 Tax=Achlya hypogyna TaxID=1202772 RepID=A0A1V9Z0Y9_ACHHY|nr:hypothetical protein ACHHYP_04569 [Achlya hypogyna]
MPPPVELEAYATQKQLAARSDGVVFVNCHVRATAAVRDIRLTVTGGPSVWLEMETHHSYYHVFKYTEYVVHLPPMGAGDDHDVLVQVELLEHDDAKLLQRLLSSVVQFTETATGASGHYRAAATIARPHRVTDDGADDSATLHQRHRISAARALAMAHRWTTESMRDTARSVLLSTEQQLQRGVYRLTIDDRLRTRALLVTLEAARRLLDDEVDDEEEDEMPMQQRKLRFLESKMRLPALVPEYTKAAIGA